MNSDELLRAWQDYVVRRIAEPPGVRRCILDSWNRCRLAGVDPYQVVAPVLAEQQELKRRLERRQQMISISLPLMEDLHSLVQGSGFIVVLADEDGYLLGVVGDEDVAGSASRGNFIKGADWSEETAGTNAVGTCIITRRPLQVVGREHYCRCSHHWTCSAAPIRDPDGNMIGVIDMTATVEKVHPHTLGMVVAAAHAIEYSLMAGKLWEQYKLADEYKTIMLQSMSDGVLAIDETGAVTQANEAACRMFGMGSDQIVGTQLRPFFAESPLLTRFFSFSVNKKNVVELTDEEVAVQTKQGQIKCAVSTRPLRALNDHIVGNIVILREIRRIHQLVNRMVGARARFSFGDLIGKNKEFLKCVQEAAMAAQTDSNALLLGESGTGKEMFAQSIHNASVRRAGPFVAINCAALPRELLASELFGYSEGAFTGAKRGGSPGKFELADGGTILLDEIGDMPVDMQVALLRVLDEKRIVRIGGNEVVPVDVRIIAATNRDLVNLVREGRFRQDLFYRLNTLTIKMVPLRDRVDDIPLLAMHFISRASRSLGKIVDLIHPDALSLLRDYEWPGNVRELENVCEHAVNLTNGNCVLPDAVRLPSTSDHRQHVPGARPLKNLERNAIIEVLQLHKGNMSRVASELGISRSTLYRKLARYDIRIG
ncbi:MAG: sigma-54-dependent Fis family transcriptional regulator [Firmicutes bacterium]|nr:sigma-54-dependent Fis family transcriptional regulator [Bacillota bacterium]